MNDLKGIKRLIRAAKNTKDGLTATFKNEEAFRIEVILAIILMPIALLISSTHVETILLIGVIFIVLIVELLNSAIEATIDRIGIEYHELSKLAKDVASAAVFLSLMLAAFVWGLIIIQ